MAFPNYSTVHEVVNAPHKTQWLDGDGFTDGAGWDVDACILNDGFTANPVICKITPEGNKVDEVVLDMHQLAPNAKADSVSIYPSGANLIIKVSYHMGDLNDRRIRAVIPNYVHPYPAGVAPIGAPGAFVPGTSPDPGGSGVTPEDIEAIKNAVVGQLRQEFGGNIRQGIEDKAKDAIRELSVLTLPLTRAGGDAGYYQQQINTAYTGALGAIRDSGLGGHTPQQTVAGPRPDSLDVNVSHAPFNNSGQLGMTGHTEEGEQS